MADYNPFPTVDLTGPATARQNIDGASPDAFGAGVGRQMSNLGQTIAQVGAAFDPWLRQERQAKDFSAEEIFQKWQNKVEAKGREDSANLTGDGVGFTDGMLKYARTSLDEDFKAGGFAEVPPEYRVKLENSIGGYAKQFAGFELNKRVANQTNAIDSAAASQLITVMQHPDGNTRDTFEKNTFTLIDKSNLPAGEKEALKTKYRQQYDYYYGLGKARSEPGKVISSVTGVVPGEGPYGSINNPYTKPIDASPIPGGPSASSHYSYLKSIGASDNEAIVLTAAAAAESTFNPAAKHDGGIGFGLYGHNGARRDLMIQRYGVAPTWQNQAQFALNELRTRPEGLKVNEAKTVQDLTNIQMAFEAPQGYEPGAPQKGHNYTGRFATTERFVRELGGQAMPTGAAMDPVIARLPPNQQLQLAGQAEREMAQQEAARTAQRTAETQRYVDSLQMAIFDGKAGEVEARQAFAAGYTSAEQTQSMINTARKLTEDRELATSTGQAIQNQKQFDPFDNKEVRGINALSDQNRRAGGTEYDAQQYDKFLYAHSGIMPATAQRGLRASIFGGNPQNVAFGLAQASEYIRIARAKGFVEPFAGVEQGEAIQKAAVSFNHLTNDLGMSPQDAANRWLDQQKPEFKQRQLAMQDEVKAFKDELRQTDFTTQIIDAIAPSGMFSSRPNISGPQRDEMNKTFAELMTERFQETSDRGEAKAWALHKMADMYGATDGVVMKWPIGNRYPAIPGTGHQYITDQAKETVKNFTGRDATNVYFLPITEGDETTREVYQQGKPPAYQLLYTYKDPATGQEFYDRIVGRDGLQAGWRPDPTKAIADYRVKQEAEGIAARQAVDEAAAATEKRFAERQMQPDLVPQMAEEMKRVPTVRVPGTNEAPARPIVRGPVSAGRGAGMRVPE